MNETDKKVRELFAVVRKKREEIQSAEGSKWVTNCNFNYDPRSSGVHTMSNIATITDSTELIRMLAFLKVQQGAFVEAAKELGKSGVKFVWGGFSYDDWKTDFQTRLTKIEIAAKKKELATLEARLNAILSPELKAQLELEEISALLEG